MSRGQFILMLSRFYPELEEGTCSYPDVPRSSPWYEAVAKTTARGWINGFEDGTFRPMEPLTRAQAAAVLNRVMGRQADEALLTEQAVIPVFTDLSPDHWAYFTLMEAVINHTVGYREGQEIWTSAEDSRLHHPPGLVLSGGEVYWAGEDGVILRDAQVGNLYFGPDGRYTCGDAEADKLIKGILAGLYDPALTREELLRSAFDYTVKSFSYLRRTESYEWGAKGWEVQEALTMLNTGRGNCYCYAAVFCLLARQLGYDAEAVSGGVNWNPLQQETELEKTAFRIAQRNILRSGPARKGCRCFPSFSVRRDKSFPALRRLRPPDAQTVQGAMRPQVEAQPFLPGVAAEPIGVCFFPGDQMAAMVIIRRSGVDRRPAIDEIMHMLLPVFSQAADVLCRSEERSYRQCRVRCRRDRLSKGLISDRAPAHASARWSE